MTSKPKAFFFDFDGVFTDGKVTMHNDGNITKSYNIKDGMGLKILRDNKIPYFLISGARSKGTARIANHLKFKHWYCNVSNKLEKFTKICKKYNFHADEVAYIGDDINDIEILSMIKYSACPNDAHDSVKKVSKYILTKNGGNGCVREFIDMFY